jgi:molybdopterin converting factor small subunit
VVVVRLPLFLAEQAGGVGRYETEAETAADALRSLPVVDLLFDERGELRPLVNVYVDGVDARDRGGLDAPLEDAAEIRVIAAVAGG